MAHSSDVHKPAPALGFPAAAGDLAFPYLLRANECWMVFVSSYALAQRLLWRSALGRIKRSRHNRDVLGSGRLGAAGSRSWPDRRVRFLWRNDRGPLSDRCVGRNGNTVGEAGARGAVAIVIRNGQLTRLGVDSSHRGKANLDA